MIERRRQALDRYREGFARPYRAYRAYGLTVWSNVDLPLPTTSDEKWDVRLTCVVGQRRRPPADRQLVYASQQSSRGGESDFLLYTGPGYRLLRISDHADFYLSNRTIICHLTQGKPEFLIPLYLLGPVISLWLEGTGVIALHASAVACGEGAIAFTAGSTGGKSSVTAAFLRRGNALLTDDILAIDRRGGAFVASASYPEVRLWPSDAAYFTGRSEGYEQVYPGCEKVRIPIGPPDGWACFDQGHRALRTIFVVDRRPADEGITIVRLRTAEALIELVRNSFAVEVVEPLGLQPTRLRQLARLVQEVPVCRLSYPNGRERLGEVCEAVIRESERAGFGTRSSA